jgi:hypothetical protein
VKAQSQAFKEHLEMGNNHELRNACHKNIRLLSRIGARLPKLWWLRKTPLDWHVAVMLWVILGPYVEDRRRDFGPSYADSFVKYALASTKELLAQERNVWTLHDPDRVRKQDVCVTREDLIAMKKELDLSVKRRNWNHHSTCACCFHKAAVASVVYDDLRSSIHPKPCPCGD